MGVCDVIHFFKKRLDIYIAVDMKEPMMLLWEIEWYGLRYINFNQLPSHFFPLSFRDWISPTKSLESIWKYRSASSCLWLFLRCQLRWPNSSHLLLWHYGISVWPLSFPSCKHNATQWPFVAKESPVPL